MIELKTILQRLKNPSIILSVASQIVTILMLFHVQVNMNIVTGVITALCSIFVLLGIMSDPNTRNKGYGDDIKLCKNCGKSCAHTTIAGELVCTHCGAVYNEDDDTE